MSITVLHQPTTLADLQGAGPREGVHALCLSHRAEPLQSNPIQP
ncbi:hypothetical protein SRS16P2_00029 (plasmid) [Variovorax sp. SRS16]|nr:hypothetical protein SRS16P2_00029 [Variovorax sp. SRS16]